MNVEKFIKRLEADATDKYNRQIELIAEYKTALDAGNTDKADKIKELYEKLHWEIKRINRRIELLRLGGQRQ